MTEFQMHQLVELQDQYSNVYQRSPTGARGWIRGRRQIMDNEPEIYIEWDKTHWRYHDEADGWTFEHHFRSVDDAMLEPLDTQPLATHETCPHCHQHSQTPDQEEFLASLLDAQESAIDSEAFVIVTLKPRMEGETRVYEPEIFTGVLDDTAGRMIEAQLVSMAAQLYSNTIIDQIKGLAGDSE